MKLSADLKRVGDMVGVKERYLIMRAHQSTASNAKMQTKQDDRQMAVCFDVHASHY